LIIFNTLLFSDKYSRFISSIFFAIFSEMKSYSILIQGLSDDLNDMIKSYCFKIGQVRVTFSPFIPQNEIWDYVISDLGNFDYKNKKFAKFFFLIINEQDSFSASLKYEKKNLLVKPFLISDFAKKFQRNSL
jgi:hypothetical protein